MILRLGHERGVEEGSEMGREEERLVSRRETLLTVFRERFLELPAELLDRIEAVRDAAVLQAAIRQAVHVERPEDVTL